MKGAFRVHIRIGRTIKELAILLLFFFVSSVATAGTGVTYHGRILKPDGTALQDSSVQFKMQVRSTGSENCLLYEETQTLNMTGADGVFSITLNDGTGTRTDTTGYSFESVFSNGRAYTLPTQCTSGTSWSPSASSGRKLVVSFKDSSMGAFEAMPTQALNFIPQAIEAQQIAGLTPADLLQVTNSGQVHLTQQNLEDAFTGSAYTNLQAVLAGNFTSQAGTVGSPSIYFSGDTNTGLYSPATDQIGFSAGGAQIFRIDASAMTSPTSGGAYIKSAAGTAAAPTFSFSGDTSTGWYAPLASTLAASTGGTERIRINASGNIGIGTTNPSALLDVSSFGNGNAIPNFPSIRVTNTNPTQGDGATNYNFASVKVLAGNGAVSGDLLSAYSSVGILDGLYLRTTTNHPLYFRTNNTDRMILDASGNLGVGTTSPGAKVEINGDLRLTGSTSGYLGFRAPSTVTTPITFTLPNGDGTNGQVLTTDGSGILSWITPGAVTTVVAGAGSAGSPSMAFSGDSNTGLYNASADQIGIATGGVSRFTIDASGLVSPTTGGAAVATANGDATNPTYGFAGNSGLGWYRPAADTLAAATSGAERVRIDPSGYVGIGTTSPGFPLVVSGSNGSGWSQGAAEFSSGSASTILRLNNTTAGGRVYGIASSGTGASQGVGNFNIFDITANATRLSINSSGYAGIGTTSPTANLEVSVNDTPAGGGGIRLSDSAAGGYIAFVEGTSTANLFSPTVQSVPVGAARNFWLDTVVKTGEDTGTNPAAIIRSRLSGGPLTTRPVLGIKNDTVDLMTILASGNVGIGTTSPSSKLEVVGDIRLTASSSGYVALKAPATVTTPVTWTLPNGDGTAGQVLKTDGSGILSWVSAGSASSVSVGAGSALSPSLSFSSDSDTGLYSAAADQIGIATSGVSRFTIDASGLVSPTTGGAAVSTAAGTAAAPTYGFAGNSGLGWYRPAADTLAAATSGAERVRIDPSGNVGIGTTSPVAPMQIFGTATSVEQYITKSGVGSLVLANTTGYSSITTRSGSSANRNLVFATDDGTTVTERMRLTSSGYVGIGTTNPQRKLVIQYDNSGSSTNTALYNANTSANSGITLSFRTDTTGAGATSFYEVADLYTRTTDHNHATRNTDLHFITDSAVTGATEKMTLTGTGNVGIGTTSPGSSLDVKGTLRLSGSTSGYVGFQPAAAAGSTTYTLPSADGTAGSVLSTDGTGILSWVTAGTATTSTVGAGSVSSPSMTFSGDTNTGFYSAGADQIGIATSGVSRFTIDASGLVSPTTGGASVSTAAGTAAAPTYGFAGNSGLGWYRPAADTLAAATSGAERVRITSTGYVGVGTTNPATLFHVKNDQNAGTIAMVENLSTGTSAYGMYKVSADTAQGYLTAWSSTNAAATYQRPNAVSLYTNGSASGGLVLAARHSSGAISFLTGGNTEKVRIDASGNVGIGTTSPSRALDVASADTTTTSVGVANSSAGGRTFTIGSTGSANAIGAGLFYIYDATASAFRMVLNSSGNVGIGTTAPRASLDVNGTALMKAAVSNATSTIDFSTGNLQFTTANCGAFALNNMKDGGSYTFVVKGSTVSTCSFTAYSDAGSTAITVHMPPDHSATTASKHTMYTMLVMGTDVYISWMPGL